MTDAKKGRNAVRLYDISVCLHLIVAILFFDLKASRPVTYQLLHEQQQGSSLSNQTRKKLIKLSSIIGNMICSST